MNMKYIGLIREDATAAPVKLTIGEVVIGRGPLLECIDKRVSRNHGLLKLSDDGNILLVATHSSPCYYTACGKKNKEIIPQGKNIVLQDGDRFALLPDSYCYRVALTDDDKIENENIVEAEKLNHSQSTTETDKTWCEVLNENKLTETESNKTNNTVANGTILEKNKITEKKISPFHVRKRVLPLWMLEENVDSATTKKTKTIQPKTKKQEASPDVQVKKQKQKKSAEEESYSAVTADKVQTNKKLHNISDDESNSDSSNNKLENVPNTRHDISDNEQVNNEQQESKECPETANTTKRNEQQNTSSTSNAIQPNSLTITKQKREQCKYATSCYRKNPQHREEFSHPGDEDFEDDSNKPECPYGVSCYRKNQLHRQSFKHATTPAKKAQRQAKTKKKDEAEYESDKDSYDEEDPFINNASSDDFQPTDSDSDPESISDAEEEESTRRMFKEAKKFMKKR